MPRKSHTNPPRCCGAGTGTWQGGCREECFLRRGTVKNTPARARQNSSGDQGGTGETERKGEEGNKAQSEKLQTDRRVWNGNTQSTWLVVKQVRNSYKTLSASTDTKLVGLVTPRGRTDSWAPPCKKMQNAAHRGEKSMSSCFCSHTDSRLLWSPSHSMHHL